ncbi:hypothetical protein Vadar_018750 [Vaccinium darrowii]|uniref:Uncharacterized protein n=1 Tax=Vaccinium darrowii TaxID=229202 RepID=A0ACB7X230_9ERIC|nr:hypothetical protein Vadar_018750 [Vaccinium darrowii]
MFTQRVSMGSVDGNGEPAVEESGERGSGSAVVAATVAVVCPLLVLNFEMAQATEARTYKVGGAKGWTFHDVGWGKGVVFRVGDIFRYSCSMLFSREQLVFEPLDFN